MSEQELHILLQHYNFPWQTQWGARGSQMRDGTWSRRGEMQGSTLLGRWDQEVCSFAIPLPHSLSPFLWLPGYDAYGAYLDNLHALRVPLQPTWTRSGEGLIARESDGQESCTGHEEESTVVHRKRSWTYDHGTRSFQFLITSVSNDLFSPSTGWMQNL